MEKLKEFPGEAGAEYLKEFSAEPIFKGVSKPGYTGAMKKVATRRRVNMAKKSCIHLDYSRILPFKYFQIVPSPNPREVSVSQERYLAQRGENCENPHTKP